MCVSSTGTSQEVLIEIKSLHSYSKLLSVYVDVCSLSFTCMPLQPILPKTGLTTVQSDPDPQGSTGPRLCV